MDASKKVINIKVNGKAYELLIKPKTTLLQLLRNEMGFTGTKQACMDNSCGACTVIVNKMAVKACSVLAMQVNGKEITSVEGLATEDGRMTPLQESFLEHSAFQCGFCTPGKLMSATAMLDEMDDPSEEDVRRDMEGNLCRCTGYVQYLEAIMDVIRRRKEGSK